MLIASDTSFGSKKVTDTACMTLESGQHGLYPTVTVHEEQNCSTKLCSISVKQKWGPTMDPVVVEA